MRIILFSFCLYFFLTNAVYGQNTGRIIFTDRSIPAADLKSADMLSNYTLTNKSNLFIRVSLARPIADDLRDLAPELPVDSLIKTGNYQFSFYVDDHLVHQTNLIPGAPYPATLKTDTVWSKPLINNQNEGAFWSQSAWNRFMYNGGDSAFTEGTHTFRLELRPYIKAPDLKVGEVIASGKLNIAVKRKPVIDASAIRLSPVKPYPGFPVSEDHFNRGLIKTLKANIEAEVFKHITGVIVIKNGKLLIEEYFNGATRDSLHDVRSVGKSFASTMTGIAIQDGYIKSEQQTLQEFYDLKGFDHFSAKKAVVSLKDLLTMSSPFKGNDDDPASPGNEENMYPAADWVKFTLDLPLDTISYKGQWHYFTAGVVLLGGILDKSIPGGLETYADRKLFKPLGIVNYKWQYTPAHVVNTAGGIRMNALDFAKYGQLYKNNGHWKGKQLLPKSWISKTFTAHLPIPGRVDEHYGYLFWNRKYVVKGKSYETFYCAGNGGNKIFVFKDQPLVVVITATAYGSAYGHKQVDQMMENYILPAVF